MPKALLTLYRTLKELREDSRTIAVESYAELAQFTESFAGGRLDLLAIVGRPGTGKSQAMRSALKDDDIGWIAGHASPFGLYRFLYEHINQPIVIDDVDALYGEKKALAILKMACQTDNLKQVSWESRNKAIEEGDVPASFYTSSPTCLIANQWRLGDMNTQAVQDRATFLLFDPSPDEVHAQAGQWFEDDEIYEWIGGHLPMAQALSMRDYVKAAAWRQSGLHWQGLLLRQWLPDAQTQLVAKLCSDPLFAGLTAKERIDAFKTHKDGGSQATFYRITKKLRI